MAGGRQIALLRGINVGRAKRVAMADLRTLLTDLGYSDVTTLLNSGNVVFTAPNSTTSASAARIEAALAAELGVTSRVTVLDAAEMADVVAENALLEIADDPSRLLVVVPTNPADRRLLEPLLNQDWAPEALAVGTRAAYIWCAAGILASRLAATVGRVLGDAATTRNWATISKLHALTAKQR
jgi:uncharacterized protein (DUF1697 family)